MNYALLGKFEDALVEARRTNQKLYMMVAQGDESTSKTPSRNTFRRFFTRRTGISTTPTSTTRRFRIWFRDFPGLGRDLWRAAKLVGNDDDLEKWDKRIPPDPSGSPVGDAFGARVSDGRNHRPVRERDFADQEAQSAIRRDPEILPALQPCFLRSRRDQRPGHGSDGDADNIEAIAIENMDEKWGGMLAKKVAGLVVKGAVGYGVAKATKSPLLGELTAWALVKADQADCRSWNLLPHDLQVGALPASAGHVHDPHSSRAAALPLPRRPWSGVKRQEGLRQLPLHALITVDAGILVGVRKAYEKE